jgi:energy-coupling factor transporter ATP-binding protein EcfA2
MQLRRIEVRDFRKLRHVVVPDLRDGLNVVVGDNEAGKSTLLAALRAALFERHRVGGEVAQRMLPFGEQVRPEIALDFELDGQPWHLVKAFCQRPEALLEGPGERITGDAVEERLAELLGFTPPGRGGSKPEEHQGAHGLLWVEQGAAHRSLGVGAGRESLAAALEAEVGQVLGGERGRLLLSQAEDRRLAFWTRTDRPRGAWKALAEEAEALAAEVAELERRLAAQDGKVAELAQRQEALLRHEREDSLARAERDLAAAKQEMAEAERLEAALRDAETARTLAQAQRDAAAQGQAARIALRSRVTAAEGALRTAEAQAQEARDLLLARAVSARGVADRLNEVRAQRRQADGAVASIEEALAHRQAEAELAKLTAQLAACEEAESRRRAALAVAEGITLTKTDLSEIEDLAREVDRCRTRQEAASVRIDFAPEGARRIRVDGQAQDPDSPLRLSQGAELDLEGFGKLRVHPGGGVDDLARETEAAVRALAERLRVEGFPDPAAARQALQRKQEAQQEAATQRGFVAALAPQGLDTLAQAAAASERAARPLSPAAAALTAATEADLTQAKQQRRSMVQAVEAAEAEAKSAEATRAAADRELATLEERAAGARRGHAALQADLAQARALAPDEALGHALAAAEAALATARTTEQAARDALDASDPELARLRLLRAERAEAAIRVDIDTLRREERDLRVELSALGRDGLGEQLSEAQGRLALARRKLSQQEGEARAARLLHETFVEAQRESKDRWLGPVRTRVRPYLRLLEPEAEVALNEDTLEIEGFVRDGRHEPFEALSMGAREQVAVITRLALADILRSSQRPSAVILDDALVNTDEGRLDRMHLVLHRAAENLQILLLTCRERDFLRLGAPVTRIR